MDVHVAIQEDSDGGNDGGVQEPLPDGGNVGLLACTKRLTSWFNRYKNCLRKTGDRSIHRDKLANEKSEEGRAYKKLMVVLEGEPTDQPSSVIMWVVHAILLLIFVILVATFATIHGISRHRLFHMQLHSWVALLMVIVSGYPFIRFITFMISEPLVWVWKMNKYVFFFARHLKMCVDITLWFTLIFWVWYTWFRSHVIKDTHGAHVLHVPMKEYKEELKVVAKQITRLLMALSIGSLVWTIKSAVFVKLLADLHYTELCERIRQTILDLHGIQFIENKRHWNFLTSENVTDGGSDEALSFWMCVSRINRKTVPIWILKRLIYTYMEHMKRKPAILRRLENIDDDEKLVEEAKNMLGVVIGGDPNQDIDITRDDLRKYGLGDKEMDYIFELFGSKDDGNPRHIITQDQFLRWVVLAVKNCLGLELSIKSSKHVFWKLNILMSLCVVMITFVIWLLLSELVSTGQMAILFAPFLSASFIFGESLRRSFDGIIFVFGMHPFDVGDRVIIDTVEMKVSEMKIFTTTFIKYDSGVEAIYPNSELSTKVIVNLDITPDQPDIIEFSMPFDTPQELICDLQVKIKKTLDDDLTYTSNTVVAKKLITESEITLIVYFKYLVSYLSAETKAQHRSKIFYKIIELKKQIIMLKQRKKQDNSSEVEVEVAILRFTINVKVKLSKIEMLKDKILWIIHNYNERFKDSTQVLFTGINKREVIMDVKMNYPKGFTKSNEKDRLKILIENAIEDGSVMPKPNQSEDKKVKVEWLLNPNWEDHC